MFFILLYVLCGVFKSPTTIRCQFFIFENFFNAILGLNIVVVTIKLVIDGEYNKINYNQDIYENTLDNYF